MDDFPWLTDELAARDRQGLRRERRVCRPLPDGWCELDGQRVRNFAGNDYLGLAADPRVRAAAIAALEDAGTGARGSALVCGRTHWHQQLEQRLAEFEEQEDAISFPTGMAANIGTLCALLGPDDVVFCDRSNHASLVDGCRLSRAKLCVYRHDDLDTLARHLARSTTEGRRYIVTDSVFSMDGDLAPLAELCDLGDQHDATVIVDEAHGTGVFGEHGRGVCEQLGVEDRVAVRIGTLSKAFGSLGGFVAGSTVLIDHLWNTARTQMFSTALPPAACAAADAAVQILQEEPARLQELQRRCALSRRLLSELGVAVSPNSTGPIVPILIGDPLKAVAIARRLELRGFLVGAIRPPTVPQGTSRLRISLTLSHDSEAVERLAQAVAEELSDQLLDDLPPP